MKRITPSAASLTKRTAITESAVRTVAKYTGFSEAAVSQFLHTDMAEGMTPADIALAIEDKGWTKLGQGTEQLEGDVPWMTRRVNVLRSRMYWLLDPHGTAAVRTWVDYTTGSGMGWKLDTGETTPPKKDPEEAATPATGDVQAALQDFWDNPKNRTITSAEGQRRLARRHLVDGELFLTIFDTDEGVLLRKVDCTQITKLLTNPDDSEEIWAYRREFMYGSVKKVVVYKDWAYQDADLSLIKTENATGAMVPANTLVEGVPVVMLHAPFNALHQRGNSLFSAALPWMRSMREFMEDRLAIVKGTAKFINKMTVKGGPNAIKNIQQQATQAVKRGGVEGAEMQRRVQDAANTFLQNDSVSLDAMPRATGAGDAMSDFRMIRLMLCAVLGLAEHYFGDGDNSNLATATAMELPMLKQFESYQQQWSDIWRDIFSIVANFQQPKRIKVAIDWPPIVKADMTKVITAITDAVAEFPELVQPEILTIVLNVLGVNNVDEVLEKVLEKQQELADQAAADALNAAKGLAPDGTPMPQPVIKPAKPAQQATGKPRAAVAKAAEAARMAAVVEALDRSTTALLEALGDEQQAA